LLRDGFSDTDLQFQRDAFTYVSDMVSGLATKKSMSTYPLYVLYVHSYIYAARPSLQESIDIDNGAAA
jgi:hypothetical protein